MQLCMNLWAVAGLWNDGQSTAVFSVQVRLVRRMHQAAPVRALADSVLPFNPVRVGLSMYQWVTHALSLAALTL